MTPLVAQLAIAGAAAALTVTVGSGLIRIVPFGGAGEAGLGAILILVAMKALGGAGIPAAVLYGAGAAMVVDGVLRMVAGDFGGR